MALQISSNENYLMHYVNSSNENFSFLSKNTLKTIFLHEGNIDIKVYSKKGVVDLNIKKNQGIILLPNISFSIIGNIC